MLLIRLRFIYTPLGAIIRGQRDVMKLGLLIFGLLMSILSPGQVRPGTYELSSDTVGFGGSKTFSRLIVNADNTFEYEYRTTLSCLVWWDSSGKWELKENNLILHDSVMAVLPNNDSVRENVRRTTTYLISSSDLVFISNWISNQKLIPIQEIYGNFRMVNE